MKPTTVKILYWSATILFALMMFMDGIGGITKQQAGIEVMKHLGYPEYVLTIFGIAKIAGAIAVIQTRFHTIKEWAYAGFTFNFIGAMMSRALAGDKTFEIMFPIAPALLLFASYFLWKKYEELQATRVV